MPIDVRNKLIASVVLIIVLFLARWLALRVVHRYVVEPQVWYRTRKLATYATTIIAAITLSFIWVNAFRDLPTYLGLVSAGIAIALSDVLKSIAAWGYILVRRPFRVGDRIEIDGTHGDVIDIRLFRFTLMEVGNWVRADQSTGRIIHIPNGTVFTTPVANYTEGFEHIWHEVRVMVTFESDWEVAEQILAGLLSENSIDTEGEAATSLRRTARQYHIKVGALTPIVYVTVEDSGVMLTGRLLVNARERRNVEQRIWRGVLRAFAAQPQVDLAYPTIRTYFESPIEIAGTPASRTT